MTHFNLWAYLATWAIVIAVIVVGRWFNKKRPSEIVIPRTINRHSPGGSNAEGMLIEEDTCPACGEHGFYQGPAMTLDHTIYCGNKNCRAVWSVVNYGPGQIWANQDRGHQAPQHLYK